MAYLSNDDLKALGLKALGKNVLLSDKASIYTPEMISIGDHSRIDDFCVLAGSVSIGRNVHVTVFCNLAGGRAGIELRDFSTLAYGCHLVAQTDDYSGRTMTNSTIPSEFKDETADRVDIGRYAILGTGTTVLPGVTIGEGVSAGAGTIFTRSVDAWGIYVGAPARRVKERSRDLLALADQYLCSDTDGEGPEMAS